MPQTDLHTARREHVAALAVIAKQVADNMLADMRKKPDGPTVVMARDQYVQIGLTMLQLSELATEHHGLLVGLPSREELVAMCTKIATVCGAGAELGQMLSAITRRSLAAPTVTDGLTGATATPAEDPRG